MRGCVRVTKSGVETLCFLVRGEGAGGGSVCEDLSKVDLSQCRNFSGGGKRWWSSVSRNGKVKFVL